MPTIPSDPSTGDPTRTSLPVAQNLALSDIAGDVAGLESTGVPNSNFEILDGSEPAQWTVADSGSGSHSVPTTSPLSGLRFLAMAVTAAAGNVSARSAKINGGNLAIDLSFIYRTTATHPRFRVQLLEYNDITLVSTLTIADYAADALIAQSPIALNINGLVGNAGGVSGDPATFEVKFIIGEDAGANTAGTIDIDAVSIVARPDIISRLQFSDVDTGSGDNSKGFIFMPASITTVTVGVIGSGDFTGAVGIRAIIDGTNGTLFDPGGVAYGAAGTSVVTPGALPKGIYTFELQANGAAAGVHAETNFYQGSEGNKPGLVYA